MALLSDAGVSVWLDGDGELRMDKAAPPELKELVRAHKQEIADVKLAVSMMNSAGIHIIRLPLGHLALAYRPGTNLDQIRWAMKVLRKESMPLVINDDGLRWKTRDDRNACPQLPGPERPLCQRRPEKCTDM
jgi:hypothetical protein